MRFCAFGFNFTIFLDVFFRRTVNGFRSAFTNRRTTCNRCKDFGQYFFQLVASTGSFAFFVSLLAILAKILHVRPEANEYGIHRQPAFSTVRCIKSFVKHRQQIKHRLHAFVSQRLVTVFDFTEFNVREHYLHNTLKDMSFTVRLKLFCPRQRFHLRKM